MDARTVRETMIKPKLADVFGGIITNSLITKSITAGMSGTTEQEKLKLMVEAICSDEKVLGMWGATRARQKKVEWLSALS